jgi:hypothetical protein
MLDRLPAEVLLDIFLLSLPPDTYSTYNERQTLLRSYCQVSRHTCRVAQPLLERKFRPKKALSSLLKKSPGLVQHVRVLEVRGEVPSFDSVFKAMRKMQYVSELRIEGYRRDFLTKEMQALSGTWMLLVPSSVSFTPRIYHQSHTLDGQA